MEWLGLESKYSGEKMQTLKLNMCFLLKLNIEDAPFTKIGLTLESVIPFKNAFITWHVMNWSKFTLPPGGGGCSPGKCIPVPPTGPYLTRESIWGGTRVLTFWAPSSSIKKWWPIPKVLPKMNDSLCRLLCERYWAPLLQNINDSPCKLYSSMERNNTKSCKLLCQIRKRLSKGESLILVSMHDSTQ